MAEPLYEQNEVSQLYEIIGRLYVEQLRTNHVNRQLKAQLKGLTGSPDVVSKKAQELRNLENDE